MAVTKNNYAPINRNAVTNATNAITNAITNIMRKQDDLADHVRKCRIANFDLEILDPYSHVLANISEELVEMVENSTDKVKQQFGILLDMYALRKGMNVNYFDKSILEEYYSQNRIKYSARWDYTDVLLNQGFDLKMMNGLVEHVYFYGDYCHSGDDVHRLTPLGYHVARVMYLKRAVREDIYSGNIVKDLEKASEIVKGLHILCDDERNLFYEPRESVLNVVNKILKNLTSSIKKDIDNTNFKDQSYRILFDMDYPLVKIYNVKSESMGDALKVGIESKAGKYLSEFSRSIGKLYNDIATNETILPYVKAFNETSMNIKHIKRNSE